MISVFRLLALLALRAVHRCRRLASAPGTARLVFQMKILSTQTNLQGDECLSKYKITQKIITHQFWIIMVLILKRQHWIKLTNLFENIFFWFQTYIANQAQYVAFILYGSKELNSRDSLNVQALGPIFMFRLKLRLNAHVPCAGKKCSASVLGSIFRINVQAQYLSFFLC